MADFQSTGAHLLPQLEELLRQGIPQDIPQELVDLLAQGDLPRDGDERVLSYIQLLTANGKPLFRLKWQYYPFLVFSFLSIWSLKKRSGGKNCFRNNCVLYP